MDASPTIQAASQSWTTAPVTCRCVRRDLLVVRQGSHFHPISSPHGLRIIILQKRTSHDIIRHTFLVPHIRHADQATYSTRWPSHTSSTRRRADTTFCKDAHDEFMYRPSASPHDGDGLERQNANDSAGLERHTGGIRVHDEDACMQNLSRGDTTTLTPRASPCYCRRGWWGLGPRLP